MVCDVLEETIPVCRLSAAHDLDTLVQQALNFVKGVRKDTHAPH